VCEFCNHTIKPIPSLEEQEVCPPEELYCCSDYADFLRYTLDHPMIDSLNKQDEKIDVRAHGSYGSLQERKEAKARAAQRYTATATATATTTAHNSLLQQHRERHSLQLEQTCPDSTLLYFSINT
jgi:hypothetical protein